MNIHTLYRYFFKYFRSKRMILFLRLMHPSKEKRILDIGGTVDFWAKSDCKAKTTLLNLKFPRMSKPVPQHICCVQGDGRHLEYQDKSYDIVFSNSVIEHLGTNDNQNRFANEVRRVGISYWVQTPNRCFFVEPHIIAPFIHWLPVTMQKKFIRWCTLWRLITRPTKTQIMDYLKEVRLLSESNMQALFPDAQIVSEHFLGMKKSWIAIKLPQHQRR